MYFINIRRDARATSKLGQPPGSAVGLWLEHNVATVKIQ